MTSEPYCGDHLAVLRDEVAAPICPDAPFGANAGDNVRKAARDEDRGARGALDL